MATILTHAIAAAALTPFGPRDTPRRRLLLALTMLSILPDLDILSFVVGIPYEHPLGHRGFSHSLVFAAGAAWGVARYGFARTVTGSKTSWQLWLLLFFATASHGAFDALTNGGLGVGFLLPFKTERFFFSFRPLLVSPIGVASFLSGPAVRILVSEILYIWLPVLGLFGFALLIRSRSRATY